MIIFLDAGIAAAQMIGRCETCLPCADDHDIVSF
jgi:hypothetical protein